MDKDTEAEPNTSLVISEIKLDITFKQLKNFNVACLKAPDTLQLSDL